MPYVATCYLEFSDFSWELLKHVQFTLSCWNHLCLSPVATKITVLSSIEENNLEYKTFKWGIAIASSFMPAWRSLRLNLGYSSFPFFFVYSTFKGFIILVPDICQPKDPVVDSCSPDIFMTLNYWPTLLCYQHGFPAKVWIAWLQFFHKLHTPFFLKTHEFVEQCIFTLSTNNPWEISKQMPVSLCAFVDSGSSYKTLLFKW